MIRRFIKDVFRRRSKKAIRAEKERQDTQQQRKHILTNQSDFYTREAYKALRTNITFSVSTSGCRKLCVTSAMASEGKSITALNVALSFAEAGQRVLLIDADLRKPKQSRLLERRSVPGLSNILVNLCKPEDAIHKEVRPNFDVIFSGDIPPNPSELLGSAIMESMLEQLSEHYDYIFMDTPPVNVVTDASVVSRVLDGVIFVVRQDESDREAVSYAIGQLEFAEAKILGFILNGVRPDTPGRYGYGKYKKYKKYSRYGYRKGYGYGYSRGYGYGYGYGYEPDEKQSEEQEK